MREKKYPVVDGPGALPLWLKQRNHCPSYLFTGLRFMIKLSCSDIFPSPFIVHNASYTRSGKMYIIVGVHRDLDRKIEQQYVITYDPKTKTGSMVIVPSYAKEEGRRTS